MEEIKSRIDTYIIKWYGPFNDTDVNKFNKRGVLYLITGYQKYQRENTIQYCGITIREIVERLNDNYHKKNNVSREREYWCGVIVNIENFLRCDLESIESLILYYFKPKLNVRKVHNAPSPIVVINRWHNKNGNIRHRNNHVVQKKLDDVIYWDGNDWHSGNLKIFSG